MPVIVTVAVAGAGEGERRHSEATSFDVDRDNTLNVRGSGAKIAVYASGYWLSAEKREQGEA